MRKPNIVCFFITVFIFLVSKVSAAEKDDSHVFDGTQIKIISFQGTPSESFKTSFVDALKVLCQGYKEKYQIDLPTNLTVTFTSTLATQTTVRMETFFHEKNIRVYPSLPYGDTIEFRDFVILAHELGHLATGNFTDQTLSESFADYLGFNVVEWVYKKRGQKAKKQISFYYSARQGFPFYLFLSQVEKQHGRDLIMNLANAAQNETTKTGGVVSSDFLQTWVSEHIQDAGLLETFRSVFTTMFTELGIKLFESKRPLGVKVEVIPYAEYRGLNQHFFNFRDGDIITHVNSKRVHSVNQFLERFWDEVQTYPVWDFIRIEGLREKTPFTLKVERSRFSKSREKLIKKQFYSWPKKKATYFTIYYKDMEERDMQEIVSFYELATAHFLKKYGLKPPSRHTYFFIEKAPVVEPLNLLGFPPSAAQPCVSVYLIFPSSTRLSLPLLLTDKNVPALRHYLYWFWLYLSPAQFWYDFYDLSELSRLAMFETEVKGFLFPMITTYFDDLNPAARETLKSIQAHPFRFFQWPIEKQTELLRAIKLYDYFMSLERDYGVEKYSKFLHRLQRQFDEECKLPTITLQDFKDALESAFGVKPQIFDTLSN